MTVLTDPIHFFGVDAIRDPYPLYDRMRAEAPVHGIGDSVFYAVCGWDAVMEDGTVIPFVMGPPGDPSHSLATADDPEHFCVGPVLARPEAKMVLGMLLGRTEWIEATDAGEWLPSILVRRLERLELACE